MKEIVKKCLVNKYVDFSTRASRKEFWLFILFYYVLCLFLALLSLLVATSSGDSLEAFTLMVGISVVVGLLLFPPMLAVCVRRLHDTGHSGWWMFLYFLHFIGILALLIVFCQGSDEENKYGPKPKD